MNNFDQSLASMRDSLPRVWWALYVGCLDAGFSDEQAFALVQSCAVANTCPNLYLVKPSTKAKDE